jgi:uncharacterized membrane protein YfcA
MSGLTTTSPEALGVLLGTLVGFSLGLTGGGGAIFAVPLLVYALGLPPRSAVGVSLATVGVTALVGFVQRARRGLVEFPTGLMFAAAGMAGAPAGAWLADRLPEAALLALFAGLMLVMAARMAWQAAAPPAPTIAPDTHDAGPAGPRDPGLPRSGRRRRWALAGIGLAAGVLAGLFGVGGGFIIVPALVVFGGLPVRRAIGTSLLVIALISAAGTANHLASGRDLPLEVAGPFAMGSLVGLFAGSGLAHRLSGPALQRVFAASLVGVAAFVLLRTLWS